MPMLERAMVCMHTAPQVLFVSAGKEWLHNALRFNQLMPISCRVGDRKEIRLPTRPLPLFLLSIGYNIVYS